MRTLNAVTAGALLLTLVSCGGNDSSSSKRSPAIDPLVTSADWKIVLEGRSFPAKSMISVNDEVVVNECADKQSYFINRESQPETLPMPNYKVPMAATVKVEVTDLGDCSGTNESSFVPASDVNYEMTKDGAHAEVIVRL